MGPITFGYLEQQSGGFAVPLYFLAGVCMLMTALSLRIAADKKTKQE